MLIIYIRVLLDYNWLFVLYNKYVKKIMQE